ncbi:heparan-alpha-glucosaminide N-acetyltransferase domain-containing protein [Malacoplasma iowae]|uniref:Heparan-alpha-glucosaminide N-acetyltransferase domain-containing protein n=1 Tax=Malacoplasma iowae 695 TaxID=1048830 RepID=A0A6P1LGH8_MALIO|nr:heparan-alpha-glucosaminide N-acetyltransferase domain-containing protein [Malacoplasma iowae]VEU62564.1 Uncharacterized conserved protein [Mycoplasmopsis fermentans]EGZ31390.1 hypothetical protein GUU_02077 [Malacoplasma iowae 695]QHG89720.1 heparan-alpha-glucosaminide N-acetyltransferase domain-containing protein [Malacoplasma iowae 695]WPL35487.1 heparan-alpha-glucosaminide N-acetyltransferase domain-containing protein [Malacoplasma iowae]VEU72251.1 Uncharacterized conserved protein [Mal
MKFNLLSQGNIKDKSKMIFLSDDYFNGVTRLKSIDAFRGMCVFCMLIFQFLKNFPSLGILSRIANHSLEKGIVILPGMTLADFIAPAFIFAIGLTFSLSFINRKNRQGTLKAFIHAIERALTILGIGTFLDLCNKYLDFFGGKNQLDAVAYTLTAFSVIALLSLICRLIGLIPKMPNLYRSIVAQIFYISLSCMGIINIIITSIDYHLILTGKSQIYVYWVTLQTIGFAILVAIPFVIFNKWVKLSGFIIIFILFSIYHQTGNNKTYLDIPVHGGVIGGFGWGAMLLLSMFIGEIYYKNKNASFAVSAIVASLGILLIQWLGNINLGSCSPTFILTTIGLSGIVFACFDCFSKFYKLNFTPFVWWGKNPIIMFLIEFFVLGVYGAVAPKAALTDAPAWLASIQGIVAVVGLTAIAFGLYKTNRKLSI